MESVSCRIVGEMEGGSKLDAADPRRRQLGVAAFGTIAVAAIFLVLALAVKQVRVLDHHALWRDDPYDVLVSFVVFFVPLTAALGIVRISLWRSNQPLAFALITSVMRGGRVLIGTMLLTVLSDRTSLALQANHAHWKRSGSTSQSEAAGCSRSWWRLARIWAWWEQPARPERVPVRGALARVDS